MRSFQLDQIPR